MECKAWGLPSIQDVFNCNVKERSREERVGGRRGEGWKRRKKVRWGEERLEEGRKNTQRNSDELLLKSPNRCKADASNLYYIKLNKCNKCKKIKKPSESKIINRKETKPNSVPRLQVLKREASYSVQPGGKFWGKDATFTTADWWESMEGFGMAQLWHPEGQLHI